MKKLLSLLLVAAMVASLTGCMEISTSKSTSATVTPTVAPTVAPTDVLLEDILPNLPAFHKEDILNEYRTVCLERLDHDGLTTLLPGEKEYLAQAGCVYDWGLLWKYNEFSHSVKVYGNPVLCTIDDTPVVLVTDEFGFLQYGLFGEKDPLKWDESRLKVHIPADVCLENILDERMGCSLIWDPEKGEIFVYRFGIISQAYSLPFSGGSYAGYSDALREYIFRKNSEVYSLSWGDGIFETTYIASGVKMVIYASYPFKQGVNVPLLLMEDGKLLAYDPSECILVPIEHDGGYYR